MYKTILIAFIAEFILIMYLIKLIYNMSQRLHGAIERGDFIEIDSDLTQYTFINDIPYFIANGGEKFKINKITK